jgi:GrpB-like predicted nucleotidyltransferase (UPF0157 family)
VGHVGLAPGSVRVVPYDPEWPRAFRTIRSRLLPLFPRARIEHIGSTSIVGCWAKPIVDVSIGLQRGGSVHVDDAKAAGLDFRLVRPGSITFRVQGPTGLTIAFVHVYARDSEPELANLHFRDYLRAHPGVTEEYSKLKRRLAASGKARSDYSPAKAPFIERAQARARRWAQKNGRKATKQRGPTRAGPRRRSERAP